MKTLTTSKILKNANHREAGIRRWDIAENIYLFYSAEEWYYDGMLLWKNAWCIHITWPQEGNPYVPIKIDRGDAWNILLERYGGYE